MSGFDVDADLVRKLAALLAETGLAEVEFEADGKRIRVAAPGRPAAAPAADVDPAGPTEPRPRPAPAPAVEPAHPGTVTSPMVGTVYLSPSPEEAPFILPGDLVEEGQTVLLVEAMKTFNEVRATRTGRVKSILVESGQPVEYGEPLAIIE